MIHPELVYESPFPFTFWQRIKLSTISFVVAKLLAIVGLTYRYKVLHIEHYDNLIKQNRPIILAFWHEVLAMAAWKYRGLGYHTLTSFSFDGELAARVIRYLKLAAVRGSSSRGGGDGLRQMEKAIGLGVTIGLTLDGPRGPRRESKPGVAILAARANTIIVPNAFAANSAWRLKSWDRFVVPKPFATIICAYGMPIDPPKDDSEVAVEAKRVEVEAALRALHEEIEREGFGD